MAIEQDVERHYARPSLEAAILDGLRAMGRDPDRLGPEDLGGADEFHMGGNAATAALAEGLDLRPGMRLLDIGCGIGGPARFFASRYGCRVTGIDLTPDYVAVAESLTRRSGLSGQVAFRLGSALDLPFEAESFDAATLVHVGMNIADKPTLFAEAHRVLRPGARFAVYDVMRMGEGEPNFPVPWAATPATSFLAAPGDYRDARARAGFELLSEQDRSAEAIEFFRRMRARIVESGPPPLGLHLIMGPEAPRYVANVVDALERGVVAPIELILRRP